MKIIKKFNVEGMSCSHCEKAVNNAINDLKGIYDVEVSLEHKMVTVQYDEMIIKESEIADAIIEAGYEVV